MKTDRDTWDMAGYCTVLYVWVYPYTHTHTPGVLDMTREDRKVAIYATPSFKATWRKFLEICKREGQSASHLVRVYVEGYVARKDPGNPHPPITAYIEGHEDEMAKRRSDLLKELIEEADKRGGYLNYSLVVTYYKERHNLPGFRLVAMAKSMCQDLQKLGVKIVY